MLSITVTVLWTKLSVNSLMSCPLANPVKKFCQADFIDATEPCIVVLASLAVVPVIPSLPWTTWIAL